MSSPVIAEVPSPPMTAAAPPSRRMTWWIAGIALIGALICCVAGGGYLISMRAAAQAGPPAASLTAAASPSETATTAPATEIAVAPVVTLEPSSTPTQAITATPTYPPLYARIDGITIDANNRYVVVYETFGYTEALPGKHVHFFFNTVPPEQAGSPGVGPWILYGGPRPFTGYRLSDRPAGASQMCALVANPDHSVVANSGNCVDLPLPP